MSLCYSRVVKGLWIASETGLGLSAILNAITLIVIIYHRQRLKCHHIFPCNLIFATFIAGVSFFVDKIMHFNKMEQVGFF